MNNNRCLHCGKKLEGWGQKKFCSPRCAVVYNNKQKRENKSLKITDEYHFICYKCGKLIRTHSRCTRCGILIHEHNDNYICLRCHKEHGLIDKIVKDSKNYCNDCKLKIGIV